MKRYYVTGIQNGSPVFMFPLNATNCYYALQHASKDELVEDMQYDKLVIEEVTI